MAIACIETKRLVLRGYSASDLANVAALWAPEMTRFNGGPIDAGTAAGKLDLYIYQWKLLGYGFWAVEDRGGTYVGHVGISHPPGSIEPKIGWAFLPAYQGQGYATEAVEAALDWIFTVLGWPEIFTTIDEPNHASLRLARRVGGELVHVEGSSGTSIHRFRFAASSAEEGGNCDRAASYDRHR